METKKRGPGRPPKNKNSPKLEKKGIVSKPINSNNFLEILYDNPMTIRKIIHIFKVYNSENIQLYFTKSSLFLYGVDHLSKVNIFVELIGSEANHFYVEKPLHICLDTMIFHNVVEGINMEFSRINFLAEKSNHQQILTITFIDINVEKSMYSIEVNANNDSGSKFTELQDLMNNSKTYPLHFSLPFKFMKRKMAEISRHSKKFDIRQVNNNGDKSIAFTFKENKLDNNSLIAKNDSLLLNSSFDDYLFIAPVFVSNIKPFAASLISHSVRFHVDEHQHLVMSALLDQEEENKKPKLGTERCRVQISVELASSEIRI